MANKLPIFTPAEIKAAKLYAVGIINGAEILEDTPCYDAWHSMHHLGYDIDVHVHNNEDENGENPWRVTIYRELPDPWGIGCRTTNLEKEMEIPIG
jgi:hypothetical protein